MWNALANEGHRPLTRGQQQQTQKDNRDKDQDFENTVLIYL